jgi:hypothetical protein
MQEMSSNVLDHVYQITAILIRMTPHYTDTHDRVNAFQPLFFRWKQAENAWLQGRPVNPFEFKVGLGWDLQRIGIYGHPETPTLIDALTNLVAQNDYQVLTAVWEMLWSQDFAQNVLNTL